jgi:SAM-dependent methyltransferase
MGLTAAIHGTYVHQRRVRVLAGHLARLVPQGAAVLDVGCGDGRLAALLAEQRPDLALCGIDTLVRPAAAIPVTGFDGRTIPHAAGTFDLVLFVDVLHHATDPLALLREAARVTRRWVLLKDHRRDGLLAGPTLRLMDRVGNARHGVALPYNYWPAQRWDQAWRELGLRLAHYEAGGLGLYPWPASWVFGRKLHFLALLEVAPVPHTS